MFPPCMLITSAFPQSFTDGISCLSQLFLDLIRQLCSSTLPRALIRTIETTFTGHLVPIDDTSTFEELVRGATDICADMIIHDTSMIDDCMWMTNLTYSLQFSILLDPETEKLRREFDGELFEEAGRISMWREFLQKVGDGEEVETNTSLAPSEVPATGVVGGWVGGQFDVVSDFVALFSPHLSRSPPRLLSSDSFVVFRIEHFGPRSTLINPDTITPNEIFDSSLFDEADNEKLARSLVRCKSVCELVGAEKCILDIETSSIELSLCSALPTLFFVLLQVRSSTFSKMCRAFSPCCLICGIDSALPSAMAPRRTFDWDGLINADLRELQPFVFSVFLILFLQHRSIKEQIGSGQRDSITQSFEMHQHAVSRIITIFEDIIQRLDGADDDLNLISYCLLISLRFNRDFPPTLTSILTLYPEIDAHTLLPSRTSISGSVTSLSTDTSRISRLSTSSSSELSDWPSRILPP
ncbi:hypothetical protein BLNAU_24949 [Blattamonas nauphoetae]|uniref:Uncharacterized protein n=1 Tax=Blattamonas nauphoetae TaxID=2049346 RepID=A0ABQ9WQ25_9EUKA|nr:hypothetical protein BLNAU_24949 [Blattamonas nauphoetae]